MITEKNIEGEIVLCNNPSGEVMEIWVDNIIVTLDREKDLPNRDIIVCKRSKMAGIK